MSNRFQTNTITAPVDRRRVHGFAPGLLMSMNPRASNLPGWQVGQGQLLIFNPRVDGFLQNKMKKTVRVVNELKGTTDVLLEYDGKQEFSGEHYALALEAKFGRSSQKNCGYRYLDFLADLPYDPQTGYDAADEYWAVVHPVLNCEMGLEGTQARLGHTGDILNKGVPWPCATCRIKFLESSKCKDAMVQSGLDISILERLRTELLASYRDGLNQARTKFNRSKGEVESNDPNTKKSYDDADQLYMRILHEKPQHIQQAEIQAQAAEIQGKAIGASVAEAFRAQADIAESDRIKEENKRLLAEIEALKKAKTKEK